MEEAEASYKVLIGHTAAKTTTLKGRWEVTNVIVGIVIAGILFCLMCLDFSAYKQRFPNAATWTYFFQHR